jgi:hypothetical protein
MKKKYQWHIGERRAAKHPGGAAKLREALSRQRQAEISNILHKGKLCSLLAKISK